MEKIDCFGFDVGDLIEVILLASNCICRAKHGRLNVKKAKEEKQKAEVPETAINRNPSKVETRDANRRHRGGKHCKRKMGVAMSLMINMNFRSAIEETKLRT
eukprot:GDKJ01031622.1.p2 GENE.GDKJ01031622.1~~GDKJ01031622.1.p2  ORF type:complete len:118 (-),score=24.72 GDKJ01031622.1:25-330(-)